MKSGKNKPTQQRRRGWVLSEDNANTDFLEWLLDNWIITSGEHAGENYSFFINPFMLPIVLDNHNIKVYQKPSQVGISELNIAEMFYFGETKAGNALYAFPTDTHITQFVTARVIPVIRQNRKLFNKVTGALNVHLIQYNKKSFYFRGAKSRKQMISVDVSHLFLDELDEYPDQAVTTLEKRLGAAENPIIRKFSTPTFDDIGINRQYKYNDETMFGSDERVYMVKCEHCGHWNRMDGYAFFTNVVRIGNNVIFVCEKCKREFNRFKSPLDVNLKPTGVAEWVAAHPSKQLPHGYLLPKFASRITNILQIYRNISDPETEEEGFKSDLGIPFTPKGARITDEVIAAAVKSYNMQRVSGVNTFMGVDVRPDRLQVTVAQSLGRALRLIYAGENTWAEMPSLIRRYNVRTCVIDGNPERTNAKKLALDFKGKVYVAYYVDSPQLYEIKTNITKRGERFRYMIAINRNDGMANILNGIMATPSIFEFPADINREPKFAKDLKRVIRTLKKQNNQTVYGFVEIGDTDFFHSLLYLYIASKLRAGGMRFYHKNITR